MREGYDQAPFNPLPAAVWVLILPIIAIEIVVNAGALGLAGGAAGIGWRNEALQRFALSPEMLDAMLAMRQVNLDYLMRLVTYPFVHGSLTHAALATVFVLALGKFVGEVYRGWAVLFIFFAASIVGGLCYSLVPGVQVWLFGAYPGSYGLIGAFTYVIWARLGAHHPNRASAFSLIAMLLGIQFLFGLLFGGAPDWIADLAGFAAGFGLSFLVAPGGPSQFLRRIRQRR